MAKNVLIAKGKAAVRLCSLIVLTAVFLAILTNEHAYAEVRKDDVVAGATVDARDLALSACPSIEADYACLIDKDGTIYFERNAHAPTQIASVTKVMTAIVALENAAPDTVVGVSEEAQEIGESSAGLVAGDTMDMDAALKALLVPSGNDAAQAIAETIGAQMIAADPSRGNDAVSVFVDEMNAKAREIGCSDTVYENPHGLDDEEYAGSLHSTAADQALVARYALTKDEIRSIVAGGSTSIEIIRDGEKQILDLETTDLLLDLYENAIGIKTGYTDSAGPCFMGAAELDGFELYAVVLDSTSEDQRFYDAMNLFEWVYEHMTQVPLANTAQSMTMEQGGTSASVPVVAAVSHADWMDKTIRATLADPDATVTIFDVDGNVSSNFEFDEIHGDVHTGDKLGTVSYLQHNKVLTTQDLIACEDVSAPNFLDGAAIWWSRLMGGFDGTPAQAESQVYNVMPIISNNVSNAA